MAHPNDPNAFLMGGGGKSAKFETHGATITGTVARMPELRQQTDMKTGEAEAWPNGDPKMQLVVALQTSELDPADPDDDGVRNLYVKGSVKAESKSMHAAVKEAVRRAGAKGLEVGGTLTVTYTGDGVSTTRGFDPPKQYEATYVSAAAGFLADAAPAPAPAAVDPATAAALANLSPEVLAALAAQQKAS